MGVLIETRSRADCHRAAGIEAGVELSFDRICADRAVEVYEIILEIERSELEGAGAAQHRDLEIARCRNHVLDGGERRVRIEDRVEGRVVVQDIVAARDVVVRLDNVHEVECLHVTESAMLDDGVCHGNHAARERVGGVGDKRHVPHGGQQHNAREKRRRAGSVTV